MDEANAQTNLEGKEDQREERKLVLQSFGKLSDKLSYALCHLV